jgi:hypothetical protein
LLLARLACFSSDKSFSTTKNIQKHRMSILIKQERERKTKWTKYNYHQKYDLMVVERQYNYNYLCLFLSKEKNKIIISIDCFFIYWPVIESRRIFSFFSYRSSTWVSIFNRKNFKMRRNKKKNEIKYVNIFLFFFITWNT